MSNKKPESRAIRASRCALKTIWGQPSWEFSSSHVNAFLTRRGGHLAPVRFRLRRKTVQPFAIAPWAQETLARSTPSVLRALRGDFFCCPFGGNVTPWRNERHPPHGETANGRWRLRSIDRADSRVTLHASLVTAVRTGRVEKYLTLVDGHTAVYLRHVLTGLKGPMSLGHHALLRFPTAPGSGVVSASRFLHAQVLPTTFESPREGGYQSLRTGVTFRSLERVPLAYAGRDRAYTDLTRFPARKGFDDLVMLTADVKLCFAWTAVTFATERYVWFALRDPRTLRHTILWMSNGGRHYPPWNARHTAVMGIEDVTAYFHYGLAESAQRNPIARRGFPTTLRLAAHRPTSILYIMGVASLPRGFDRVTRIERAPCGIELVAANGQRAHAVLDPSFLETEDVEA